MEAISEASASWVIKIDANNGVDVKAFDNMGNLINGN